MGLFRPDVTKLRKDRDVDGLRTALRGRSSARTRYIAAWGLGEIELPPGATERRGLVPQEAVAELMACWRDVKKHRKLVARFATEAVARIGGPAAMDALVGGFDELTEDVDAHDLRNCLSILLGADGLVEVIGDDTRSERLRLLAREALTKLEPEAAGHKAREREREGTGVTPAMGRIAHIQLECPRCGRTTNAYIEESKAVRVDVTCESCKGVFEFGRGMMYNPIAYVSQIPPEAKLAEARQE